MGSKSTTVMPKFLFLLDGLKACRCCSNKENSKLTPILPKTRPRICAARAPLVMITVPRAWWPARVRPTNRVMRESSFEPIEEKVTERCSHTGHKEENAVPMRLAEVCLMSPSPKQMCMYRGDGGDNSAPLRWFHRNIESAHLQNLQKLSFP